MSTYRKPHADGRDWVVRVKRGGKYLPLERFDTEAEAKRRERQLKGVPELAGTDETVREFAERWLDDYPTVKHGPTGGRERSTKTRQLYQVHLKRLCEELGAYPLPELSRREARALAVRDPRTAVVARNMFSSALEDGYVQVNPFQGLNLRQPKGRKEHGALTVQQFHDLADLAPLIHSEIGPMLRAQILFTCYVGPRLTEGLHLQWDEVQRKQQEVRFSVCKFDKPRTVLLAARGHHRPGLDAPAHELPLRLLPQARGHAGQALDRQQPLPPLEPGQACLLADDLRGRAQAAGRSGLALAAPHRRASLLRHAGLLATR